ncbi:hypothetical protein NQZ68_007255 [Dissostichus eleginoides]|nr:hypothetical protein NQZ68_007255 [Dissostichus eleginoides]
MDVPPVLLGPLIHVWCTSEGRGHTRSSSKQNSEAGSLAAWGSEESKFTHTLLTVLFLILKTRAKH